MQIKMDKQSFIVFERKESNYEYLDIVYNYDNIPRINERIKIYGCFYQVKDIIHNLRTKTIIIFCIYMPLGKEFKNFLNTQIESHEDANND